VITPTTIAPHVGSDALDRIAITRIDCTPEVEVRGMDADWIAVVRARLRRAGFRCSKVRGGDGASLYFRVAEVRR